MVKTTIIGGGSSTFTPQLIRLFLESEVLSGSTITLMDIDSRRLGVMTNLSKRLVENEKADLEIQSTTDQRASLVDADFVITAISVGGFDAWEKDIEIPARYGVYMPIADSVGPGGIMRAFRHIPILVGVGKDLEEVSPNAWVFNYTNPVTANTMAMNRHTNIKTVGLCTCSSIPRNSKYLGNIAGVKGEELLLPAPAGGLNHCAAILSLLLKDGRDAFLFLKEKVKNPIERWGLENYDVLPYCWSHWTEFFPSLCRLNEEYKGRLQGLKMKYGIEVHNMEHERERAEKWERLVERISQGEGRSVSLASLPEAEAIEVVEIIEAILSNRKAIHVVNITNEGAIGNLPKNAIVEVSCVVSGYGIQPIHVGSLPWPLAATLSNHVMVQELTVEAALRGDRNIAYKAFLQDPQVSSKLTPDESERMLNDLLSAHAPYLPTFT